MAALDFLASMGINNWNQARTEATFGSKSSQNYDCCLIGWLFTLWGFLHGGIDKAEREKNIAFIETAFASQGWPLLSSPAEMCEKIIGEVFTDMESEISEGRREESCDEVHISQETVNTYRQIFQMVKDGKISLAVMEELSALSRQHLHGCRCM